MTNKFIHLTHEKNIAIIEIDNAPANALSTNVLAELKNTLKEVNLNESVQAVILSGKGKFFVAGADIKEFVLNMGDKDAGLIMSKAGELVCIDIELIRIHVI